MNDIKKAIKYLKFLKNQNNTPSIDIKLCTAVEALEKQVPMKVKRVCDYYDSFKYCPCCDCNVRREMTFCQECGQALDWQTENGITKRFEKKES